MDNCGNVRMDKYWNFVVTPFFTITLMFGLYTLFISDEVHFGSQTEIRAAVEELRTTSDETIARGL